MRCSFVFCFSVVVAAAVPTGARNKFQSDSNGTKKREKHKEKNSKKMKKKKKKKKKK